MKQVFYIAAALGQQYLAGMATGHDHAIRGEYHCRIGEQPIFEPHSIRLSIHNQGGVDGQPATVVIRPTVPGSAFGIDVAKFTEVQTCGSFLFHSVIAVNDRGGFKIQGSNDHGPFEIDLTTDAQGFGAQPASGLMISVITTPFEETDWGRE